MVISYSSNQKEQDRVPIIINDALEHEILSWDNTQIEDPTGLKKILEEQNGHISSIGENDSSQIKTKSPNTKNDSLSSLTLPSIHNADETAVEAVGDILEDHHTLRITSDEFEGVDCGCCKCGGRITRQFFGCSMAFLSGLFFTANNFVIKAARLSFGEIIAVRSIIQIPLLSLILFMKGDTFWPTSVYQRIMLCVLGLNGSLMMLTSFACVKFMPVSDAITLIFTAPLFTMVLAAIVMKEKITVVKAFSGLILMAGIVLVTRPSFIFPDDTDVVLNGSWIRTNTSNELRNLYQDGNFFIFELRTAIPKDHDVHDYYFIGALLALSCAVFTAASIVLATKMGNEVSTTLQLLYIGVFAFVVAGFVEFIDDRDRFFTSNIIEITAYEWGIYIGLSFSGMLGFLFEFKSCRMVAPATVATLRTTEIVVAFVAQILLTSIIPQVIDILGAAFVFFAATALIFEKLIYDIIAKLFSCNRCKTFPVSQDRVRLEEDQNIIPPTSIT